jgi:hypothetical protein
MIEKEKQRQNSKEEYDKALVGDDPTQISNEDLQRLAKEAVKKFKSL